jgi:hypothetical protein
MACPRDLQLTPIMEQQYARSEAGKPAIAVAGWAIPRQPYGRDNPQPENSGDDAGAIATLSSPRGSC